MILERETNDERKAFYGLLWHLGGSSSDVANLRVENIDWVDRTLCYNRKKTAQFSGIRFGPECEAILRSLPTEGALFPYLASVRAGTVPQNSVNGAKAWGLQESPSTATATAGPNEPRRVAYQNASHRRPSATQAKRSIGHTPAGQSSKSRASRNRWSKTGSHTNVLLRMASPMRSLSAKSSVPRRRE